MKHTYRVWVRENREDRKYTHLCFTTLDEEPRINQPALIETYAVQIDDIDDELGIFCTKVYVPRIQQS